MAEPTDLLFTSTPGPSHSRSRRWTALGVVLLLMGVALFLSLDVAMHRAEPILRTRVIQTLSARFDSRVELADFHVSVLNGLEVSGGGLTLYPNRLAAPFPLFSVKHFEFSTGWNNLLKTPMHVGTVTVYGLEIHLPPKEERVNLPSLGGKQARMKIEADRIVVQDANLVIGTSKPGKVPLDFEISRVEMKAESSGPPWAYEANLVNPKPVGNIHATGHLGPWQAEGPGNTPLDGQYIFRDADLSTFRGIAGILSSTGSFTGVLNRLTVDGQTDTPDFKLTLSGKPAPLHTTFHATVDGTSGDTYLHPVEARLSNSHFTAVGSVVRVPDRHGHHIIMDVVVDRGRIEDFLGLAVRAEQPLIKGAVQMNTRLEIPPGPEAVYRKMRLNGSFALKNARFTSDNIQSKLDELSTRGQGMTKAAPGSRPRDVQSQMQGHFDLADSRMNLQDIQFDVPGADIQLDGTYDLDSSGLDIHGKAKLEARLSQMTTGWKSMLLKPVNPFFAKDGAGTELPFKITGTRSDMKFGLDFNHGSK